MAARALPPHAPAPGAALPRLGPSRAGAAGPVPQPAPRLPAGTVWTHGPAGHPGNSGTDTGSRAGRKAAADPLRKDAHVEGMWSQTLVPPLAPASVFHPRGPGLAGMLVTCITLHSGSVIFTPRSR